MSGQTPQHTYGSGSGSGIDLNIIEYFETVLENMTGILEDAMQDALSSHQSDLQRMADKHPDWKGMASDLQVSHVNDSIHYTVKPSKAEEFMRKEYGEPGHAMRPLVRPFIASSTPSLVTDIERNIARELG